MQDTEKSSDASLQLAETLLLAPLILEVEDEFSVKPVSFLNSKKYNFSLKIYKDYFFKYFPYRSFPKFRT